MNQNSFLTDFLRGTGCAASALLFSALGLMFGYNSALILFISAAAMLYLCILLLRVPFKRSRIIRTVTAFLMYPPMIGAGFLIDRHCPTLMLGNMSFNGLCFLLIILLPGSFLLMLIAAVYAKKQKTHPFIPLVLMYLLYAVFQADAFRFVMKGELTAGSLYYSEYARCGFYELCGLAVIHLIALFLLNNSIVTGSTSRPKRANRIAAVLCLYTVFISATVLAQIRVYIRACGTTAMRTSAMQYAALIGIVFLVLFIRQLFRKLPEAEAPAVPAQI